jgi:hypothetical protein
MFGLVKRAAAAAKPAASRPSANVMQTRLMSGGHGHGGPPPTGLEAKVRAYLPKDYQVRSQRRRRQRGGKGKRMGCSFIRWLWSAVQIVLATLGFYTSLVLLFKLKPSKKAVEAAPAGASVFLR